MVLYPDTGFHKGPKLANGEEVPIIPLFPIHVGDNE